MVVTVSKAVTRYQANQKILQKVNYRVTDKWGYGKWLDSVRTAELNDGKFKEWHELFVSCPLLIFHDLLGRSGFLMRSQVWSWQSRFESHIGEKISSI